MTEERKMELRAGIRADGTIEGYTVETTAAAVHAMMFPQQYGFTFDHKNKYIAFTIDAGGTDEEVRLPFELVEWFVDQIKSSPIAKNLAKLAEAGKGTPC